MVLKCHLKRILSERKMSQRELAKLTDNDLLTIQRLINIGDENSKHKFKSIPIHLIEDVSDVLGLQSPNELFYFDQESE